MIFAGDQWIQYPVKDLYDKGIMQMAIQTARDMYEKGQQEIKDFNTKYGDFLTPIQKDQDWYNENVTGKMQDVINNLYANGIDPVRSAEGRAAISQFVNTMPVGDIAKVRTSAAAANEYLKNKAILQSKGLWNPELESQILGGKSVEDWDTMGSGQVFTRTSPTEYQDLNQFTSHIFDNIKDSYIGTRDGYDYFGVTANDLMNSLTPDTLGGLLNSDLGRFHYNNARNDLLARGIENPTNDQIMQQFRNNIIAANNERIHSDRKMNEQYKLDQEHASRMAAARRSAGGGGEQQNAPQYSFRVDVNRNALTSITGQTLAEYSDNTLSSVRDVQIQFGKDVSEYTGGHSHKTNGIQMYKKMYMKTAYRPEDIVDYLPFQTMKKSPTTMIIDKNNINRLYDIRDVVSHTTGFRGKVYNTNRSNLRSADYVTATATGRNYGGLFKDDRTKNFFEVEVKTYKNVPITTSNGSPVLDENGNVKTKLKQTGSYTKYLDSHITSRKNVQGVGSLGIPSKDKPGSVYDGFKGTKIVDEFDSKYGDATHGDKYVSEKLTKNTVFDVDRIIPEEPGYNY